VDGILASLIAALEVRSTSFVEFGVEDGIECNTRFLAEVQGWEGVYFESAVENYKLLARRWSDSQVVEANKAVALEKIADLFSEFKVALRI
jgi:hypothetical protein